MFTGTKRKMGFLAWTASVVVTLGVAAGASAVVPQLINSEDTPSAASSVNVAPAATVEAAPAEVAVAAEVAPAEVIVPDVAESEVEVLVTTPVTKAPAPKVVVPAPVVAAPAPVIT
ncbi:MAG: hypothetical protein QOE93_1878, partial [Actinomycetota bacterium]|nr:hypothetical protein [Actinomycetota bacterium]